MASLFKRAKEAAQNFIASVAQFITGRSRKSKAQLAAEGMPVTMETIRGKGGSNMVGYKSRGTHLTYEEERNRWKYGGTGSCIKAARAKY